MAADPSDQRSVQESFKFSLPREPHIHIPRGMYRHDGDHDPSAFVRNAIVLSKQAAKYSANCPHIGLFDYNSMFLFDFKDPVRFRHAGRDERIHKGCWFAEPDYRNRSLSTRRLTFRKLLWAFVARALIEWKTDEKVANLLNPHCNVDRHKAFMKLADEWAKNEAKARKRICWSSR